MCIVVTIHTLDQVLQSNNRPLHVSLSVVLLAATRERRQSCGTRIYPHAGEDEESETADEPTRQQHKASAGDVGLRQGAAAVSVQRVEAERDSGSTRHLVGDLTRRGHHEPVAPKNDVRTKCVLCVVKTCT